MVVLLPYRVRTGLMENVVHDASAQARATTRTTAASVRPREPLSLTVGGLNHSLIVYLNLPRCTPMEAGADNG